MSKLRDHLQKHLFGEAIEDEETRQYFSTDGSVFEVEPRIVVYPRNAEDVRKTVRFSWQLAERGKQLPITARGKGTDQAGGALGSGMIVAFPAHMNELVELDGSNAVVEPGLIYGDLQNTLKSHDRFLPPYPSSMEFSTIGGAIANNAGGEKTIKYGKTADFVESLNVVLANGEHITVEKISNRELNKKKGQTDFEGEIYRKVDGLLEDHQELIEEHRPRVSKNSAGYNLWDVKTKDGFDLSKLLVGSQGTLGVVTQATLSTEQFNSETHLMAAYFDDLEKVGDAIPKLLELEPSALEVVDYHLLKFLQQNDPHRIEGLINSELPAVVLLIEFDDRKKRHRKKRVKKARKALNGLATDIFVTEEPDDQEKLWKIRHSAAALMCHTEGQSKALPIIEDGVVPPEKIHEFLERTYQLFEDNHLEIAVWGHAGNGNFHMQPFLDLSNVGDRQKMFSVMDDYYNMVLDMGGSTTAEHNDGRLRAPYLAQMYGDDMYQLFREIKRIFDPHNILNPGVKIDVAKDDLKPLLRSEYDMQHLHDHLPRVHH